MLIGGVGAYLLLPAATIVVAPKEEPVGPVQVTIVADPTATAPDADAGVVPAEVLTVDAATTDTFPATGKRVETTRATGTRPLREPGSDVVEHDRLREHRPHRRRHPVPDQWPP